MKSFKILLLILFVIATFSISVFNQNVKSENIINVEFCDLLKNPNEYEDKLVRVSAIYSFSFEASVLYCPNCEKDGKAWFDCSKDAESCISKKFKNKFREKHYGTGKTLKVTVVGKFNTGGGFGHFGVFPNQFLTQTVERAEILLNYGGSYQALSEKDKAKISCIIESKKK